MKQLLDYWPLLLFVINAVTTGVALSLRQLAQKEVKAVVEAAVSQLAAEDRRIEGITDEHDHRLTVLEQGVKNLPTKEDMAKLAHSIAGISQSQAAQGATLAAVKESAGQTKEAVDRLYRYFLEKGA